MPCDGEIATAEIVAYPPQRNSQKPLPHDVMGR